MLHDPLLRSLARPAFLNPFDEARCGGIWCSINSPLVPSCLFQNWAMWGISSCLSPPLPPSLLPGCHETMGVELQVTNTYDQSEFVASFRHLTASNNSHEKTLTLPLFPKTTMLLYITITSMLCYFHLCQDTIVYAVCILIYNGKLYCIMATLSDPNYWVLEATEEQLPGGSSLHNVINQPLTTLAIWSIVSRHYPSNSLIWMAILKWTKNWISYESKI